MRHDVAVIGGALTGLSAALALAKRGLRVAIVEAREAPAAPDPNRVFDPRVSALTPVSWQVLANLGVANRLPPARVARIDVMQVWDRAGFGELAFDAADAGLAHLGAVVENRELEFALGLAAAEDARIRWYRPARVLALDAGPERISVHTDVARLEARLVVAADGTRSGVRDLAGIRARERSYQQQAVVTTVHAAQSLPGVAWQRFLGTGPLALLPLPGGFASMIWSTTPEHAQALCALPDSGFAITLSQALEQRLGEMRIVAPRQRFPLLRVSAERYLAPRVALIGDAAHTIHPLAGQGVNLGILDAASLADVVGDLFERGRDIGNVAGLRRYERTRRAHNAMVGDVMTAFHRVFTTTARPIAILRNVGFAATQRLTPVKRLFIHYASGFAGPLPSLADHARDY